MNEISQNIVITMSSLEIAKLVEQRHDNVKRTIDTLVSKAVIVRPQFEDEQSADTMGRQRTTQVYRLGKRDSLIVVAQLCPEFTAKIVDRWQELEEQLAKQQGSVPSVKDPRTAALIESLVRLDAFGQEQNRQAVALARVQEDVAVIEARIQSENKHFTVAGYAFFPVPPRSSLSILVTGFSKA